MADSPAHRGGAEPAGDPEDRRRVTADIPPCHCVICESETAAGHTLSAGANESFAEDDLEEESEDAVRALVPG